MVECNTTPAMSFGPGRRLSLHQCGEEEAQRFKWIESEKAGRDLGETAIRSGSASTGMASSGIDGWSISRVRPSGSSWTRAISACSSGPSGLAADRSDPRPLQARPREPRHHPLGDEARPADGRGAGDPRGARRQQPPDRVPLRPAARRRRASHCSWRPASAWSSSHLRASPPSAR